MDAKLNQSDLIALLAKESNISAAKAEQFTKNFFELIIEGLEQDGIVKINGLGTFKVTEVASRGSVNVNTGEKIEIKGHNKLAFIPADALKDTVNQPFAMFEPVEVDETYQPDATTADAENDETTDDIVEETTAPIINEEAVPEDKTVETPAVEEVAEEKSTVAVETDMKGTEEIETVVMPENATDSEVAETQEPECVNEPQIEERTVTENVIEPVVVQEKPAEPVLVRVPKKNKAVEVTVAKKKKHLWIYVMIAVVVILVIYIGYTMMSKVDTGKDDDATVNVAMTTGTTQTAGTNPTTVQQTNTEQKNIAEATSTTAVTENVPTEGNVNLPLGTDEQAEAVESLPDSIDVTVVDGLVATDEQAEAVESLPDSIDVTAVDGLVAFEEQAEAVESVPDSIEVAVIEEITAKEDAVQVIQNVQDSPVENNVQEVVATEKPVEVAETVVETVVKDALETNEPYKFVMVPELASKRLKYVTLADTTLYVADGELTVHTVAMDERLTKIARIYYGDKKLWPYIVKYNNMKNPNALRSGMKISIPRLVPKK